MGVLVLFALLADSWRRPSAPRARRRPF